MNTTTMRREAGDILVPNELERRQIFFHLKKASSYTGNKRILDFFQKWADVTEASVREADNSGMLALHDPQTGKTIGEDKTSIEYSRYVGILKALATFEEGVTRLGRGDKRVFTYSEANGFFMRAWTKVSYWSELKNRVEQGEIGWQEATPYNKEFFKAFDDLCAAGSECHGIGEVDNAPMSYGLWEAVFLSRLPYPDPLPEVPEPKENIVVKTGEQVPCSGIWEPMEEGRCVGSMNYLLGDTRAPKYTKTFLDPSDTNYGYDYAGYIEVVWRLIWRDDRYEDGTIPEEEKSYPFLCPVPEGVEDPYDQVPLEYIRKHNLPHPFLANRRQVQDRVEGGQPCPKEGFWWSPANKSKGRIFKKGEIMPIVESTEYGICYWLWGGKI